RRSRREDMHLGTLSAVTCTSPHKASLIWLGGTTSPVWASSNRRAANSLGGKCTTVPWRSRVPSGSRRNFPKQNSPSEPMGDEHGSRLDIAILKVSVYRQFAG